ncbi:MAG: MMPL family transporter [Clostridia bacterium]|nr:MMPL family transporter [Clostridia bacterium]
MKKITMFLLTKKYIMPIIFAALCIISIFTLPLTKVNYDQTKYLPQDTQTSKGLKILYDEFGENASLSVMVKDLSLQQALEFKALLIQIDGAKQVVWLDDIVLPYKPEEISTDMFWQNYQNFSASLPDEVKNVLSNYYNGDALFTVILNGKEYEQSTISAIEKIDKLGDVHLSGEAAKTYNNVDVTYSETFMAMLIIIPLAIIILLFATDSFIKPFLFLLVMGVSVIINMGSNAIFGEISYLTQATAAILQMALSIDYMIILSNRFNKEREKFTDIKEAMCEAVRKSILPIAASSLTTIAGFVALMFMRYSIGFDMGIVLTKGIFLSLLTVLLLMPSLMILLNKAIEKTSHKTFKLSFKGLFGLLKKSRFVLPVIMLILIAASAYAQYNNEFIYGDSASTGGKGSRLYQDRAAIEQSFGRQNQLVILVPKSDITKESTIAMQLTQKEYITSVSSYSIAKFQAEGSGLSLSPLTEKQFLGENYFRIILNLNVSEEGDDSTAAINDIKSIADGQFTDYYLIGNSASVLDIKKVTDYDYNVIMAVSIGLVFLVLLFSFKSILMPLLLIFVIQGSIWINYAYPYLFNQPIIFIGLIMVSCIQLGATIDYGIILSESYMHYRKSMGKFDAALASLQENKHSVITSASIMCGAGFALSIASTMPGVSMIGVLVGRGALTSGLLVLILLPQLFMLFDKGIHYTSLKSGFLMPVKKSKTKENKKI